MASNNWTQSFPKDAHLSLELEQQYQNFSFSCWLKPTGKLNNPLNSLIRPYRWKKLGNLSIEVTRSGKLKQFLWGESNIQGFQSSKRKLTKSGTILPTPLAMLMEKQSAVSI